MNSQHLAAMVLATSLWVGLAAMAVGGGPSGGPDRAWATARVPSADAKPLAPLGQRRKVAVAE